MATNKRAFTLRLPDDLLDKIGVLAEKEHRSTNNYIECILQKHLDEIEKKQGEVLRIFVRNVKFKGTRIV